MAKTTLSNSEVKAFKQAVASELGVDVSQLTEFEVERANHQGYKYAFSSKHIQVDRMRQFSGVGDIENNEWLVVIQKKTGWLS